MMLEYAPTMSLREILRWNSPNVISSTEEDHISVYPDDGTDASASPHGSQTSLRRQRSEISDLTGRPAPSLMMRSSTGLTRSSSNIMSSRILPLDPSAIAQRKSILLQARVVGTEKHKCMDIFFASNPT